MVTGDNIRTAQSIAKECGILRQGYITSEGDYTVMEGPDFFAEINGLVDKNNGKTSW